MMFTIEFFRIRKKDNAHATLDRVTYIASDLESAKVKARSLFDTLNMPQNPDGLRILDQSGNEVFFWTPKHSFLGRVFFERLVLMYLTPLLHIE